MIETPTEPIDALIATRLHALRLQRGWSLAQLADASGVSKAMISRVERAESSPTATVLGRLAAALGVSLSELLDEAPAAPRWRPRAQQPLWRDPALGYQRRQVSPRDPATGVEIVEITLPRATRVAYPPWSGEPYRQRLVMLEGALRLEYGDEHYALEVGDCLHFGVDRPLVFASGRRAARYLLVLSAR